MKILDVRLKNLNSLAGEWFIDFTHPAYVDSGIFAITGPTGAGKTTILDAICLALYGETPRLASVSKANNEIISRGAAECSAEIHFETQKGRFRCTWQQRRARGRSDGQLQSPEHELVDAQTDVIINNKLSEVKKEVANLTGLDFDRFTRSMLLAQGKFAAFLQSGANERAPILEQITGTEFYSQISIEVFKHSKEVDQALERLKAEASGIETLSPDEVLLREAELAEKQSASDNGKQLIASLSAQIQWLQGLQQLQAQCNHEEQNQAALHAEILAFASDKKKLELDSLARQLDISFSELRGVRQVHLHASAEVEKIQGSMPKLESSHAEKQKQLDGAEQLLIQKRNEREQLLPLLEKIRSLDKEVGKQREDHKNLSMEVAGIQARANQVSNEIVQHQSNRNSATEQHRRVELYLNEHAQDATLVEQFSGIESDICTWLSQSNDLSRKKLDREGLQRRSDSIQTQVERETEDVERSKNALGQKRNVLASGEAALEALLQGKLLREYESERDHLLEEKRLRSIIKSLEEHRMDLRSGTPCPLCGATEHPYANIDLPTPDELDERIARVQSLIRSINEHSETNRKHSEAVQVATTDAATAELRLRNTLGIVQDLNEQAEQQDRDIQGLNERLESQREALLTRLSHYGFSKLPENEETTLLDTLSERRDQWQLQQTSKTKLEASIAGLDTMIQTRQAIWNEINNELNVKSGLLRQLGDRIEEQVVSRRELLGEKDPDTEDGRLIEELRNLEKGVAIAGEQMQEASDACKAAKISLGNFAERAKDAAVQLESLEPAFQASRLALGFAEEIHLQEARLEDPIRDNLARIEQDFRNRQFNIEQVLVQKRQALKTESDRKLTERPLSELVDAKLELEQANELQQRRIGEIQAELRKDRENATRQSEKAEEICKQQVESDRWGKLNELIGSADGKKYRNFVQALTFERLVQFANAQLSNMTDRYLLIPDKDESLSLNVIDKYHAGAIRTTKNLSGGESFIVSLALALGLSRMASQKVRVDSLFLDEGFGTLDEEALDVALNTLSDLHQEGKMIGIISHVPALKERISTQIKVAPMGAGRSSLRGPGCSLEAKK